jgi:hypothetical protein
MQYEEEESEQMQLIANKIVNCNRTMWQIARQLEEVMDEQSALGHSQEVKLADMIFKHRCTSLRERLRIRSTMLIEETLRSLADVKTSQKSVIDLQGTLAVQLPSNMLLDSARQSLGRFVLYEHSTMW